MSAVLASGSGTQSATTGAYGGEHEHGMPMLDPKELNKLAEFAEMGGLGMANA